MKNIYKIVKLQLQIFEIVLPKHLPERNATDAGGLIIVVLNQFTGNILATRYIILLVCNLELEKYVNFIYAMRENWCNG